MRLSMGLAGVLLWAGGASAQLLNMDFGVASEVVRGLTSERTAFEIQQSTNLLASYRDVAIQQELAQEAVRRGLTERVDVQRTLEQYRRQVLVQALRQDFERRAPAPTQEQIAAAYKERMATLTMPAAYQMDAWLVTPQDTQSLALAKSFASGKPVADETVSAIPAPRLVSSTQDIWLTSSQMTSNVWAGLMTLQLGQVQLFPEGSNTMVVRRGAFRAQRQLTLEEAKPTVAAELQARQAAALWQAQVERIAKEMGLENDGAMKAADLRGILGYIARFRDKLFVLNIDSEVMAHENFHNLLLDISVLRSLNIRIVIVHGASYQIRALSAKMSVPASDYDGMGVTDSATLQLAILASNQLTHEILEGLNATDQRAVVSNAIIAHPAGILKGVDQQCSGRVERVDASFLQQLLDSDVLPVIPPLGFDGNGQTYRVNSDQVALEVAEALRAAKLIFLTTSNGPDGGGRLSTQIPVAEAEEYLKQHRPTLTAGMVSKLEHGTRACRNGVQRAHIIDGRQSEALLNEIFSNEGVGTMIYANEYEAIRKARKKDVGALVNLIRGSVDSQQLLPRSRQEIASRIGDFSIFEIDRNVVACVGVHSYPDTQPPTAELECLFVAESHENQGIGRRLMQFAEAQARDLGAHRLLALSTQTFSYFVQKGGYAEGQVDMLPPERAAKYAASGRHSKILYKDLH